MVNSYYTFCRLYLGHHGPPCCKSGGCGAQSHVDLNVAVKTWGESHSP